MSWTFRMKKGIHSSSEKLEGYYSSLPFSSVQFCKKWEEKRKLFSWRKCVHEASLTFMAISGQSKAVVSYRCQAVCILHDRVI